MADTERRHRLELSRGDVVACAAPGEYGGCSIVSSADADSQVMVDKITALKHERIGTRVAKVADGEMEQVAGALETDTERCRRAMDGTAV